jgi:hypothetical protein
MKSECLIILSKSFNKQCIFMSGTGVLILVRAQLLYDEMTEPLITY